MGRRTVWLTPSPPMTVKLRVTTNAKEQNVETMILMSVMMVFAIRMVVTGQSTDLVIKTSMDLVQNTPLIPPNHSPLLPSSSPVTALTVEILWKLDVFTSKMERLLRTLQLTFPKVVFLHLTQLQMIIAMISKNTLVILRTLSSRVVLSQWVMP